MDSDSPANDTRSSLLASGLHLFGLKGFEGTSTRELAAHAGTNVASISYHFGGKAGLREACAREVANRVGAAFGAAPTPGSVTPEQAVARIEAMVGAFVQLIVASPQARDMVAFMLRELTEPEGIAMIVYDEFLEPRHAEMCGLWAVATGRPPDDPALKLAVFAMIGQILYFRIAAPIVSRRMDWGTIGPDETRQVRDTVIAGLRDALERLKT